MYDTSTIESWFSIASHVDATVYMR